MRTLSVSVGLVVLLPAFAMHAQATWVIEASPVVDVAGMTPAGVVAFGYPAGGMRLADGSLLIADRAENNVRLLDPSGRLQRSTGRRGDGPGEFQTMVWAGRCGTDSLLIWDLRRRQASMIAADGSIGRQFAVPAGDTAQSPFQFSCSNNGAIAYRSAPRPARGAMNPQNPSIVGVTSAVYEIEGDGRIRRRLGDIPAGEVVAMTSPSGGRGAAPRPLGRAASLAVLDDAVIIGSPDSAFVTIIQRSGASSRHSLPIPMRAPTRAEFDDAVQATASVAPPAMRQAMVEQLTAVPLPERLPPISALFTDSEGLIWVQTTPPGGRVLDFLVMDRAGRLVARTQVPRGITVFDIGRDHVLGSYTDSSDEMHVVVYRLRRS